MDVSAMFERAAGLRLASERVVVRRFQAADRATAIAHELDRRIMQFVRDPIPESELEGRLDSFFSAWNEEDGAWLGLVAADRATDAMLGVVALRVEDASRETIEVGYRLHPDHQGRGLASEAVRSLLDWLFGPCDVRKVTAFCVAENDASFRLMERLGMRREGCLRQFSMLGGKWCDELVYGILQSEWQR